MVEILIARFYQGQCSSSSMIARPGEELKIILDVRKSLVVTRLLQSGVTISPQSFLCLFAFLCLAALLIQRILLPRIERVLFKMNYVRPAYTYSLFAFNMK